MILFGFQKDWNAAKQEFNKSISHAKCLLSQLPHEILQKKQNASSSLKPKMLKSQGLHEEPQFFWARTLGSKHTKAIEESQRQDSTRCDEFVLPQQKGPSRLETPSIFSREKCRENGLKFSVLRVHYKVIQFFYVFHCRCAYKLI